MSTHLSEYIKECQVRWNEIDNLFIYTKANHDKDAQTTDTLSRASIVLAIAHFEGFCKGLFRAFINDLNHNCRFEEMPANIKKAYCQFYLPPSDQLNIKENALGVIIQKLNEKFSKTGVKLSSTEFLFREKQSLGESIITKTAKKIGLNKIYSNLHDTNLDQIVLEGFRIESKIPLIEKLENYLNNSINDFPYKVDLSEFKLKPSNPKETQYNNPWGKFIKELHRKRHSIAHGSSTNNPVTISELENSIITLKALEFILVLIFADKIANEVKIPTTPADLRS